MRNTFSVHHLVPVAFVAAFLVAGAAMAGGLVQAELAGTQEVPALSTTGTGLFLGQYSDDLQELAFVLAYSDLEGAVAQAHLHFGQLSVNGGVSVFLCTNLGNGPPGTPLCPSSPGIVDGVLSPEDVLGPTGQGIDPGEWEELRRAIVDGAVYVNVHSDLHPGGEIRGQLTIGR